MDGVDDSRHTGAGGGPAADDSGLAAMSVNDIGMERAELFYQGGVSEKVLSRKNGAAHRIKHDDPVAEAFSAIEQRTFRADGRAGDERDVMAELVLAFAGEEGVFLRAAHD